MKPDGPMKHFILAFLLAVICYAFFYNSIEHRRTRKGPWKVGFSTSPEGWPQMRIDQPKLAITNVEISFLEEPADSNRNLGTILFSQPQSVPYDVPFGKCIFVDTTFLPGTVTFRIYGHEIELLPRVLIIDHQERPWLPSNSITLHPIGPEQNAEPSTNAPSHERGTTAPRPAQ
jgi:hypothetical protein